MKSDVVERGSLHFYSRAATYANAYLPNTTATRACMVLGTTVSLQLISTGELVEQVFMAVINLIISPNYDALVYLRKASFSLIKVAACPISIIALPILYYSLLPERERMTTLSNVIIKIHSGYHHIFSVLVDTYLPRPRADKSRILAAIDRACKSFGKLDSIKECFLKVGRDYSPIFITDEWHRYWEISKWQMPGYRESEPIKVEQLTFRGGHYASDSPIKQFTLSLEHTKQLREMLN